MENLSGGELTTNFATPIVMNNNPDPVWNEGDYVVLTEAGGEVSLVAIDRVTPKGFAVIGDRLFRPDGFERVDGVLLTSRSSIRYATYEEVNPSLFRRLKRRLGLVSL